MDKRGVSPIIATVLILIITFVAVSIVAVFVVPFVQQSIEGSEACFEVLGDLEFDESPYNCHASNGNDRTGFSVKIDSDEIAGFRVSLFSQGSSDTVGVTEGIVGNTLLPQIRMLSLDFTDPLSVPQSGGVRTYVAEGIFTKLELNAILDSGETCDVVDEIDISPCLDSDIANELTIR